MMRRETQQHQTAISDEEIIAALMGHASIQAAAASLGMSARAVYDRMGTRDFKAAYSAARGDVIRQAVSDLTGNLSAAVQTITDIMRDTAAAPAVRLQAAKMLMDNAGRFTDRLQAAETDTAKYAEPAFSMDMSKW